MQFDAILTHAKLAFASDGTTRLQGQIYADSRGRFGNGEVITTSAFVRNEGQVFFTKNTRYLVVFGE